ncbi:MAG: type II toxin-antitoxin system YafQ family toxin [Clostridiales bacterium]|jgi:mRNA interferase YafQ|nr:type II toxin-antitoxin system YafQ family toxin [Clostridiales bacterium]
MYKVILAKKYKRDLRLAIRQGKDINLLEMAVDILSKGTRLPPEYNDHPLKGKYKGCRECHIAPDWLLVYKKYKDVLVVLLTRTGTHQDIFDE